jgi:hypothetical protein
LGVVFAVNSSVGSHVFAIIAAIGYASPTAAKF